MKDKQIKKILDDSKSVKGTRRRSKEIEEIVGETVDKVIGWIDVVGPTTKGLSWVNLASSIDREARHYKRLAEHYCRLAIAGWTVAFILSVAFIWQNVDSIIDLTQYVKWVG